MLERREAFRPYSDYYIEGVDGEVEAPSLSRLLRP